MSARPPVSPRHAAQALAAFVDTLLPGDDVFPPASETGAQALLADRLRARHGASAVFDLVSDLDRLAASGSFGAATIEQREEAVRRLESEAPDRFAFLYAATCYAYYASPFVTAAIRSLGHAYNEAPQPDGYDLPKFDFTPGINVPFAPKGTYKATWAIERVDLSSLTDLHLPVARPQEG